MLKPRRNVPFLVYNETTKPTIMNKRCLRVMNVRLREPFVKPNIDLRTISNNPSGMQINALESRFKAWPDRRKLVSGWSFGIANSESGNNEVAPLKVRMKNVPSMFQKGSFVERREVPNAKATTGFRFAHLMPSFSNTFPD